DLKKVPIAEKLRFVALFNAQYVGGWKFPDTLADRQRGRDAGVTHESDGCLRIDAQGKIREGTQRAEFGCKQKGAVGLERPEQGLDTQPIADKPEATVPAIPEDDGKHAIQFFDRRGYPPDRHRFQDDFSIRVSTPVHRLAGRLDFATQLRGVVEFA